MHKDIYIFSGLGADERVFQKMDFSGFTVHHVHWIPNEEGESIESYAKRLSEQIPTENPLLIGLSFGGIMAIEIAKQIPVEKVVLLASAKTRKELPWYFRLAGNTGLHRLLPNGMLRRWGFVGNWFFSLSSHSDKKLLREILDDSDPKFLRWCINCVVNWKNTTRIPNLVHIHGTGDRVFPGGHRYCDHKIKGGGHFMTMQKAEELSRVVKSVVG